MKKLFSIFLALVILTSCIFASADTTLYTCQPKIGLDPTKNAVDFDFTLSDNMPNDYFVIAMYIENALDTLTVVSVSDVQAIIDENKTAESDADKKYVSLELEKTPDSIKVFAWSDNLIPVCTAQSLLTSSDDFVNANKVVHDNLTAAKKLLYDDIRTKVSNEKEEELYLLLYNLSTDALSRNDELLFTRDNAQEIYSDELQIIKKIYDSMTKDEKDHFYYLFYDLGRVKFSYFDYLINYLGIKSYVI